MSTVTIPPVLTSPRDDAMHLYRAFKGTFFFFSFISFFFWGTKQAYPNSVFGFSFFSQIFSCVDENFKKEKKN